MNGMEDEWWITLETKTLLEEVSAGKDEFQ